MYELRSNKSGTSTYGLLFFQSIRKQIVEPLMYSWSVTVIEFITYVNIKSSQNYLINIIPLIPEMNIGNILQQVSDSRC